jgi:predicted nuclease of restriction endonuclease-like (RecB) superfamily
MTATYWEVGRRIVEFDQAGERRATYGGEVLQRLSADLTSRFGRGYSRQNLQRFRQFYLAFPLGKICSTASGKSGDPLQIRVSLAPTLPPLPSAAPICSTLSSVSPVALQESGIETLKELAGRFPLPWSHYVLLVSRARSPEALDFYHEEAIRGGWSVRTLDRQLASLFYERTALSTNKARMLTKRAKARPGEALSATEAVRDPYLLEFLNLKDDYSESDLEEALIQHLQKFLLELGDDFAFVDRQRRLRLDSQWYRVDLLFFHRTLKCLVVIDLKLGKFTHADAGQMNLYLNYARQHWSRPGENPPIGLILCSTAEHDVAQYALGEMSNQIIAADYRIKLPDEKQLLAELRLTRSVWEARRSRRPAEENRKPR